MNIFILKKLRKLFKSLGKYEYKILDKITLLENKKQNKIKNIILDDNKFLQIEKNLSNPLFEPKKISIVICFHYNKKRIKNLIKICKNISSYRFSKDVSIITNNINNKQSKFVKKQINKKLKKYSLVTIKNNPEPNLLPWYCLNFMKKKYKDKSFSHFLYLEDDILINSKNINYWIYCRKILKSYNLIPAFLRCEIINKNLISVDNQKKIKIKNTPKILSSTKKYGFLNMRYPYHGACFMDRNLMNEYSKSNLIGIDYGSRHKIMKMLYPVKELANIIIGYINVPKGYFNRFFIPFIDFKKIPIYCTIKHLDNKYSKDKNSYFGKIKVENLLN